MEKSEVRKALASQTLKEYRKNHHVTQEELAEELSIDPRTLRLWESGRPPENMRELRRISDLLGIEPERLGLAASIYIPKTPEQIEEVITHIWSLVEESRLQEAFTITRRLTHNLQTHITTEDPKLLRSVARAHHAAGYVISEATRASESYDAILQYEQMEAIARTLNDHTLLNIALTYQGDMYRRLGNHTQAITYLEAARDTTPQADNAAKGNGMQLLGRAYLRVVLAGNKEIEKFRQHLPTSRSNEQILQEEIHASTYSNRPRSCQASCIRLCGRGLRDKPREDRAERSPRPSETWFFRE